MSMGSDDLYAGAGTGRWVGVAGIVAAVLFVPGFFLMGGTPEYNAPDAEWVDWFDKDANTTGAVIATLIMVVAALTIIVFAAGLAARLRAAGGQRANAVMLVGAAVAAGTAFMVGAMTTSALAGAIAFAPDFPVPGPEDIYVAKAIEQIGFGIVLVAGGWSSALMVAIASFSARRTGQLPTWLTTGGIVVAVLLLASIAFLPLLLLPIWLLVTGIVLLGQGPASPVTPGPAGMR